MPSRLFVDGEETEKCGECKWPYPDWYMSQMATNEGYTKPICGICALRLINEAHGIHRKAFTGEYAESMRQMALTWRETHKDLEPK